MANLDFIKGLCNDELLSIIDWASEPLLATEGEREEARAAYAELERRGADTLP